MLDLFVLRPELSITVEQNGEKVDILETSDSFCNDMIGEDGCIDLFRGCSTTKKPLGDKHFRAKYDIIGAKEMSKTSGKACT